MPASPRFPFQPSTLLQEHFTPFQLMADHPSHQGPPSCPVPPWCPQARTVVSVRRVVPSSDVSTDTTDMAPSGSSSMVYVSSTIWPGSCILGIVLYKRWLWS